MVERDGALRVDGLLVPDGGGDVAVAVGEAAVLAQLDDEARVADGRRRIEVVEDAGEGHLLADRCRVRRDSVPVPTKARGHRRRVDRERAGRVGDRVVAARKPARGDGVRAGVEGRRLRGAVARAAGTGERVAHGAGERRGGVRADEHRVVDTEARRRPPVRNRLVVGGDRQRRLVHGDRVGCRRRARVSAARGLRRGERADARPGGDVHVVVGDRACRRARGAVRDRACARAARGRDLEPVPVRAAGGVGRGDAQGRLLLSVDRERPADRVGGPVGVVAARRAQEREAVVLRPGARRGVVQLDVALSVDRAVVDAGVVRDAGIAMGERVVLTELDIQARVLDRRRRRGVPQAADERHVVPDRRRVRRRTAVEAELSGKRLRVDRVGAVDEADRVVGAREPARADRVGAGVVRRLRRGAVARRGDAREGVRE